MSKEKDFEESIDSYIGIKFFESFADSKEMEEEDEREIYENITEFKEFSSRMKSSLYIGMFK